MWKDKDTTKYKCFNGISHPIYDCQGMINYSLPLDKYPPAHSIHPQIPMVHRMHMNYRDSPRRLFIKESFKPGLVIKSAKKPGYPLPSPYGDIGSCGISNL
jgi:hypothetical protein